MSWSEKAMGVDFKTRGKFLYDFLQMKPEDKNCDKFYKDVVKFIISSFVLRSEYRYVSEGVHELLESWGEKQIPKYNQKYTDERYKEHFIHEHTIPTSVIVDYFQNLIENDSEKLTADFLSEFFEKVSGIALLTKKDDENLNDSQFRQSLPKNVSLDDILLGKKPHYIRYKEAKIKLFYKNDNARP